MHRLSKEFYGYASGFYSHSLQFTPSITILHHFIKKGNAFILFFSSSGMKPAEYHFFTCKTRFGAV